MRDRLDERDLSHLRYLSSMLAAHPQEAPAVLAVVRDVTRRSGDDPLAQVLTKIDQELETQDWTVRSVADALVGSPQPNLKRAGETLDLALKRHG